MLAANLMRSLHNVEIRQIMSAFHLDPEKLRENGIDLIISTVPLDLDFPSICVSPIPQAQDMLVITNAVESIGADRAKKSLTKPLLPDTGNEMTWEDIRSFTRTGEEISQLLEHFRIQEIPAIQGAPDYRSGSCTPGRGAKYLYTRTGDLPAPLPHKSGTSLPVRISAVKRNFCHRKRNCPGRHTVAGTAVRMERMH